MEFLIMPYGCVCDRLSLQKKLGKKSYDLLLEKLTIVIKSKVGCDKIRASYMFIGGDIILPRYVVSRLTMIPARNFLPAVHARKIEFDGLLSNNQTIVVENLLATQFTPARVKAGLGFGLLNMKAGQGKTYVAAGLINALQCKTLYITPDKKLQIQTLTEFQDCFPQNKSLAITTKTCNDEHDIGIIVINTFVDNVAKIISNYSLLIFDEIHSYIGDKRSDIYWYNAPYVLGMSATTGENKDGLDNLYIKHLGEPIYADQLPGFEYDRSTDFTGSALLVNYLGPPEFTEIIINPTTGLISFYETVMNLMRDPARNALIMKLINQELLIPDRFIFVFTEYREHLEYLYPLVQNIPNISLPEVGGIKGGIKTDTLKHIEENARVIISTYRYGGTGLSWKKMNTIIEASPRVSGYKQIVPRILRKGGDTTIHRRVYDIVDENTALRGQIKKRLPAYKFYNFDIKYVNYSEL